MLDGKYGAIISYPDLINWAVNWDVDLIGFVVRGFTVSHLEISFDGSHNYCFYICLGG
jgi:hypothetical protein